MSSTYALRTGGGGSGGDAGCRNAAAAWRGNDKSITQSATSHYSRTQCEHLPSTASTQHIVHAAIMPECCCSLVRPPSERKHARTNAREFSSTPLAICHHNYADNVSEACAMAVAAWCGNLHLCTRQCNKTYTHSSEVMQRRRLIRLCGCGCGFETIDISRAQNNTKYDVPAAAYNEAHRSHKTYSNPSRRDDGAGLVESIFLCMPRRVV